jgi:hypothetical protein
MMKEMKNVRIRCDPEEGLVWIEEDVDEREAAQSGGKMP